MKSCLLFGGEKNHIMTREEVIKILEEYNRYKHVQTNIEILYHYFLREFRRIEPCGLLPRPDQEVRKGLGFEPGTPEAILLAGLEALLREQENRLHRFDFLVDLSETFYIAFEDLE